MAKEMGQPVARQCPTCLVYKASTSAAFLVRTGGAAHGELSRRCVECCMGGQTIQCKGKIGKRGQKSPCQAYAKFGEAGFPSAQCPGCFPRYRPRRAPPATAAPVVGNAEAASAATAASTPTNAPVRPETTTPLGPRRSARLAAAAHRRHPPPTPRDILSLAVVKGKQVESEPCQPSPPCRRAEPTR
jgi:hypothetical protein